MDKEDICKSISINFSFDSTPLLAERVYVFECVEIPNVTTFQFTSKITRYIVGPTREGRFHSQYVMDKSVIVCNKPGLVVDNIYRKERTGDFGKMECSDPCQKTAKFHKKIEGCLTDSKIHDLGLISGSYWLYVRGIGENYSYKLCDKLLGQHMLQSTLGDALTDVECHVSGQVFRVHRVILSARSPVFAAMFSAKMSESETGQVTIVDVTPETFRDFLQFLYTGSLDPTSLTSVELEMCADKYQVDTLFSLCQGSSQAGAETLKRKWMSSTRERDEIEYDVAALQQEPVITDEKYLHRFTWDFSREKPRQDFQFGNTMMTVFSESCTSLRLFGWNPYSIGLKITDVKYRMGDDSKWRPMHQRMQGNFNGKCRAILDSFANFTASGIFRSSIPIHFCVDLGERVADFSFRLLDSLYADQLWSAADSKQFTDVEFVVAGKSFAAHQAIVAARSTYFSQLFLKDKRQHQQCVIQDVNPDEFEQLLYFMYTGTLKMQADNKDLLRAATKYGVSTLQNLCQDACQALSDVQSEEGLLLLQLGS